MCGINGFLNFSGAGLPDPEAAVRRMNAAVRHRGPDDTGVWSDPDAGAFLGHQRLSILDLSSAGHQPMRSPRGSVIVYNGEIYNFRDLKAGLPDRSYFSETDTEVLLYAYERDPEGFLEELNGMFAFAIWDPERRTLTLARDRIGIKPLYYTTRGGVFAFASEIKALLTLPWIEAELDEEALYHFLTFSKVMAPRTMFEGIYKLRPGYRMTVGERGVESCAPYWETTYTNYDHLDPATLEEQVRDTLERSVERRMISDVPVGAFLSGGVDSSAVVALMSRHTDAPVSTYSIGFRDAPTYDERAHAHHVARLFETDHHERIVGPEDIRDFLPRIVDVFDEPLADETSIPIYFLSQLARENGTIVVLTGDGADELFGGYTGWMRYVRLYPYYRLLARMPSALTTAVAGVYGRVDAGAPAYEIVNRAAAGQEFFWGGARAFKESVKRSFLSDAFSRRLNGADSHEEILYYRRLFETLPQQGRRTSDIDWMCFLGLKSIVPNTYLYRADRLGMAHSIELRVPFLDHTLVNLALSVPGALKTAGGEAKAVLKRALEPVLPRDVLYRKKMGFSVPLQAWAGDVMLASLEENVGRLCRETGLFDEAGLRTLMAQARSGNRHHTSALWNVYFLESWFRKWLL